MKAFEDRTLIKKSSRHMLSVSDLRTLLPERTTVDILVQKYILTFETTYRILHIPSFEAAYKDYWTPGRAPDVDMDILVLAVLACMVCVSTHENPRYCHNGSTFHNDAVIWIKTCEAWIKQQSNKNRTLQLIQVRCLRILALSATSHKEKGYYQEVQAHMGYMRSCGMHRDPSLIGGRCTPFEGEMRRRMWATSMELELQASIDKGTHVEPA